MAEHWLAILVPDWRAILVPVWLASMDPVWLPELDQKKKVLHYFMVPVWHARPGPENLPVPGQCRTRVGLHAGIRQIYTM